MRVSDQGLFYILSEQVPVCFDSDMYNAVFPVAQSELSKHKLVLLNKIAVVHFYLYLNLFGNITNHF